MYLKFYNLCVHTTIIDNSYNLYQFLDINEYIIITFHYELWPQILTPNPLQPYWMLLLLFILSAMSLLLLDT